MSKERELTIDELDAVSGGAHVEWTYTPQKSDGAVDYPPTTGGGGGPAGAWNACLGVFGYGPQA
jgi:hypothetical protein